MTFLLIFVKHNTKNRFKDVRKYEKVLDGKLQKYVENYNFKIFITLEKAKYAITKITSFITLTPEYVLEYLEKFASEYLLTLAFEQNWWCVVC